MIEDRWPRIAGIHVRPDGGMAAVWIAHDKDSDCLHLYDCHIFDREVLAVVAEGLNRRGKWVPIAWHQEAKEIADNLLDRGCNTIPEPLKATDAIAEVTAREIEERMRTGRFKVDRQLDGWIEEFRTFHRQDQKMPIDSHPLMAATRHAVAMLEWARPKPTRGTNANYPRLAIV